MKKERLKSVKTATRELARHAIEFGEDRQPAQNYLLVPKVSSENREFVPLEFIDASAIINPAVLVVLAATMFHFGVPQSTMHMARMRQTAGRMKSDYQFSAMIVYNNFPWPDSSTATQKQNIETAAQSVLDARATFPDSSLADLYDPLRMPPALVKAHQKPDATVDAAYEKKTFKNDAERDAFFVHALSAAHESFAC